MFKPEGVTPDMPFWNSDVLATANDDYRLWLGREIEPEHHRRLIFLMLNPSKARGEGVGDPTQRKCDGFSKRLGFNRYGLINLFTLSTPYPKDLFVFGYEHAVGPDANKVLERVFRAAAVNSWPIIIAWGKPNLTESKLALVRRRIAEVREIYEAAQYKPDLHCLAMLDDFWPRHPLMLGYNQATLKPWSFQ